MHGCICAAAAFAELEHFDWVNSPVRFSEQFTAQLWATHQIDAFRTAPVEYVQKLNAARPCRFGNVTTENGTGRRSFFGPLARERRYIQLHLGTGISRAAVRTLCTAPGLRASRTKRWILCGRR